MPNEFVAKNGLISKGNVYVTGSVTATSFTGSFSGSIGYSQTAGNATNATHATQSIYATQSLWATRSIQSTYATSSLSASYSNTSSWALNVVGGIDTSINSTYSTQSLWATRSLQATYATSSLSASWASSSISASYITASGVVGFVSFATSASNAANAIYATNAGNSTTADYATNAGSSVIASSATYATEAGQVTLNSTSVNKYYNILFSTGSSPAAVNTDNGNNIRYNPSLNQLVVDQITSSLFGNATTATNATNSISASYAMTASYIGNGTNNYVPVWINNNLSSTSSIVNVGKNVGIGTTAPSALLHLYSTNGGDQTWDNNGIIIENVNATTGEACLSFRNSALPSGNYIVTGINQNLQGYGIAYGVGIAGSNTLLFVSSSGNIGIGSVIAPTDFKLQVAGDVGPDTTLEYDLGSPSKYWGTTYTDNILVSNNATITGQLRVTGSSTFESDLYLVNSDAGYSPAIYFQDASGSGARILLGDGGAGVGNLYIARYNQGSPNGTYATFYSSSGNISFTNALAVGTTATPTATLQILRGTATNGTLLVEGTTHNTHFNYSTAENHYIRGGKAASAVYINDNSTHGHVYILASSTSTASLGIGTNIVSGDFKVEVAGHVGPRSDSAYDLGSSGKYWRNLYADTVNATSVNATSLTGSIAFTGKTDNYVPVWINNNLSSTSSIVNVGNNIGIATTSPNYTLDVNGNVNIDTTLSVTGSSWFTGQMKVNGQTANPILIGGTNYGYGNAYNAIRLHGSTTQNEYTFMQHSAGDLFINRPTGTGIYFRASNTNQVAIDTTGYLGVGTATPSTPLHLRSTSAQNMLTLEMVANTNVYMQFKNSNPYSMYMGMSNIGHFSIKDATSIQTSPYFTVNSGSGNVGIGVALPTDFKLQVLGDVGPQTTLAYDLGSPSRYWDTTYTDNILVSNNATIAGDLRVTGSAYLNGNSGITRLIGSATGDTNLSYMGIYDSAGTRMGFIGDSSSTNSDIYLAADNNKSVRLYANGTTPFIVSGSTGYVGINTTIPSQSLHVVGIVKVTAGVYDNGLEIQCDDDLGNGSNQRIFFKEITGSKNYGFSLINNGGANPTFNGTNFALPLQNHFVIMNHDNSEAGSVAMSIARTGGNIGIGTDNPSSFKLQVVGNVGPQTTLAYDLGSPSRYWQNLYAGTVNATSVNATSLTGSLNITSPMNIGGNTTGITNLSYINFNDSAGSRIGYIGDASSLNSDMYIVAYNNAANDNNIHLYAGGATRLFVSASGNIGIGITNPTDQLSVVGSIRSTSRFRTSGVSGNGYSFYDSDSYRIYMATYTSGAGRLDATSDYNMYFTMNGGTNRGFVFANGTTPKAQFDSDGNLFNATITPRTDSAYDIGTPSIRHRVIYADAFSGSFEGGGGSTPLTGVVNNFPYFYATDTLSNSSSLTQNTSTGNVGIGTSDGGAAAKFNVYDSMYVNKGIGIGASVPTSGLSLSGSLTLNVITGSGKTITSPAKYLQVGIGSTQYYVLLYT
jgi:hypothetical protein